MDLAQELLPSCLPVASSYTPTTYWNRSYFTSPPSITPGFYFSLWLSLPLHPSLFPSSYLLRHMWLHPLLSHTSNMLFFRFCRPSASFSLLHFFFSSRDYTHAFIFFFILPFIVPFICPLFIPKSARCMLTSISSNINSKNKKGHQSDLINDTYYPKDTCLR